MNYMIDPTDIVRYEDEFQTDGKTKYQKIQGKYIYKTHNDKWVLQKCINGEKKYFGLFETFEEAKKYRDKLTANNWKILTPKIDTIEDKIKEYYKSIYLHFHGRKYIVKYKGHYVLDVNTIEEALYARDLLYKYTPEMINIKQVNLKENNPYIVEGLLYELPERLILKDNYWKPNENSYINKKGNQCFQVKKYINGKLEFFGSYATYEYAHYIRDELMKCNWDKKQLPQIKANYKYYYTEVLHFYKYIFPAVGGKWAFRYQKNHLDDNGKIICSDFESNVGFTNIEEALWERDLYFEYGDDITSRCEDSMPNPYYDMELPIYPTRRKKVRLQKDHFPVLYEIKELLDEGVVYLYEVSEQIGLTPEQIRIIMKKFNTTWPEFKQIVLSGEDLNVLEPQKNIINPDVTVHYKNNNYVTKDNGKYRIQRKNVYYGRYNDYETALNVSKELEKVNWDKKQLNDIRLKCGCSTKFLQGKKWVYPSGKKWCIRKKDKNKKMVSYGSYNDKKLAELIRDKLIDNGWNKDLLSKIQEEAEQELNTIYNLNITDEEDEICNLI